MEEFGNYWIERVDVIGSGSFGKVEKIRLYNHSKTYFKEYALKTYSPDPRIPKMKSKCLDSDSLLRWNVSLNVFIIISLIFTYIIDSKTGL